MSGREIIMRIAICDDEEYILSILDDYVSRYSEKYNSSFTLAKFKSGEELLSYMDSKSDIDIIFLDIQMPGINGIDTAHMIRKKDSHVKIFFLTSLVKYVLEGYSVRAERYLIKPLKYNQFEKELQNVVNSIELENNRFFVEKNDNGIFKVMLSDVLYIETVGRNTLIHTMTDKIVSYRNMKEHETLLDKCFFRCYRAYIVNLAYVKSVVEYEVVIGKDIKIPLSKYRKKQFKEALLDYYGDQLG